MRPFSRSDDLQNKETLPTSSTAVKQEPSVARDQTDALLRNIKKRRNQESSKAGSIGAGVVASCGVKLKRRIRKNTREKQRRLELNDKFDALNDLLPTSGKSKTEKYHILSEAIKLIGDLQQENEDLRQEKLGLANELQNLSIYMREVSTDLEQPAASSSTTTTTTATATPVVPSVPPTLPPVLPAPPVLEYMDYKLPARSSAGTGFTPENVAVQFATPRPIHDASAFSLQASLDALVGFDMPLPFPPLPPTPSGTPPPDLFSSITGSYAPTGMGLTNAIVGPYSNTLFQPSSSGHNMANMAGVNTGDDIDTWMS